MNHIVRHDANVSFEAGLSVLNVANGVGCRKGVGEGDVRQSKKYQD